MGKNQDPGSGINIPDPPHWIGKRDSKVKVLWGYIHPQVRKIAKIAWEKKNLVLYYWEGKKCGLFSRERKNRTKFLVREKLNIT